MATYHVFESGVPFDPDKEDNKVVKVYKPEDALIVYAVRMCGLFKMPMPDILIVYKGDGTEVYKGRLPAVFSEELIRALAAGLVREVRVEINPIGAGESVLPGDPAIQALGGGVGVISGQANVNAVIQALGSKAGRNALAAGVNPQLAAAIGSSGHQGTPTSSAPVRFPCRCAGCGGTEGLLVQVRGPDQAEAPQFTGDPCPTGLGINDTYVLTADGQGLQDSSGKVWEKETVKFMLDNMDCKDFCCGPISYCIDGCEDETSLEADRTDGATEDDEYYIIKEFLQGLAVKLGIQV